MTAVASVVVAATALGSATVGGVFFAFDAFVLRALVSLEDGQGARAMRAINIAAVRPALMTAMFGTAVLAVGVVFVGLRSAETMQAVLLTGGAAAYLLGSVLTTVARNVPLNNRLASAATSPSASTSTSPSPPRSPSASSSAFPSASPSASTSPPTSTSPSSPQAPSASPSAATSTGADWPSYAVAWARANRLRTVAALGAATALLAALALDG